MIRRVQTKHVIRPHGHDATKELTASEHLELVAVSDGPRRDVLVRRPEWPDYLIYDGNIAGIELDEVKLAPVPEPVRPESWPADAAGVQYIGCSLCDKEFVSERALKGHMARVHR